MPLHGRPRGRAGALGLAPPPALRQCLLSRFFARLRPRRRLGVPDLQCFALRACDCVLDAFATRTARFLAATTRRSHFGRAFRAGKNSPALSRRRPGVRFRLGAGLWPSHALSGAARRKNGSFCTRHVVVSTFARNVIMQSTTLEG